MNSSARTLTLCAVALFAAAAHADFETRILIGGLAKPLGVHVDGIGPTKTLYFTQVPTPGVPGSQGGRNTVDAYLFRNGTRTNLTMGEPEPTNLSTDLLGNLYWTCKSANVILQRRRFTGTVTPFLTDLNKPSGISADRFGQVYFTQLPTPGVPGGQGGMNTVDVFSLGSVFNLTRGEPEPTDIAVSQDGSAYWTCKSANVILVRTRLGQVSVLFDDVKAPSGISINSMGTKLYYTEVPTPGVSGANGGMNRVVEVDLTTRERTLVNFGDPEPTDVTVARDGAIYWSCTSAGVIVEARRR